MICEREAGFVFLSIERTEFTAAFPLLLKWVIVVGFYVVSELKIHGLHLFIAGCLIDQGS
jgi:hypothetical protein